MKEILHNSDNLTEKEITEKVIRTKALLVNSNNEVLLGYCEKQYQFPGGHLEKGETLLECLKREVKEETGINIDTTGLSPIYVIKYYNKDYPDIGKNRSSEIYFYVIKTDEKYDLNETNYDDGELLNNFELRYLPLESIEEELSKTILDHPRNKWIVPEIIEIINEYKNLI